MSGNRHTESPDEAANGGNAGLLWALRERVKELTCLYGITQITAHAGIEIGEAMQRIVDLLPPAWQYPEITTARLVLDEVPYVSAGFLAGPVWQTAAIMAGGAQRGSVEVFYREPRPALDEGPFLAEERSLINAVARQVAQFVERHDAAEERTRLQVQLRHADRLATIGQLAAGVAHELNEPLANILGFAQLAARSGGLPEQTRTDLDKIVAATLHAREIVRKLMLFSRQMPPAKAEVNLNSVIEVGLDFLAARCAKQGIELIRRLDPALPAITADPGQIHQVLVNLVVNAIQAMPAGGRLTIRTGVTEGAVCLAVEDTGAGMSDDVLSKIFLPFFTTKEVDQGTGLGLSVAHGIVSAHGGSIRVQSAPDRGSRFEVVLPRAPTEG